MPLLDEVARQLHFLAFLRPDLFLKVLRKPHMTSMNQSMAPKRLTSFRASLEKLVGPGKFLPGANQHVVLYDLRNLGKMLGARLIFSAPM